MQRNKNCLRNFAKHKKKKKHNVYPATDIGVLVEWGILASNEWNDNIDYTYLNMTLLFTFALISIMLVRFVFFAMFYIFHRGIGTAFLCFIFPEYAVFDGVKVSHKENMAQMSQQSQNTKVNIEIGQWQSLAQMLEATVESMPQVLQNKKKQKKK